MQPRDRGLMRSFARKSFIKLQQMPYYHHFRDRFNRIRYGQDAPVYAERLWVDPEEVVAINYEKVMQHLGWGGVSSGMVIRTWPFRNGDYQPVLELPKVMHCIKRYRDGLSWEDAGAIEYYKSIRNKKSGKPKFTEEEIFRRHERFDSIYKEIRKEGRFKTMEEVRPGSFREEGGVLIHFGPAGEPLFSETGSHRLAMALLLKIPRIPVQIGVVHTGALVRISELRINSTTT